MIVAIDGPAGAGKTTISKQVANALGFIRLDTGALYRAVGLAALNAGKTPHDHDLQGFVEGLDIAFSLGGIELNGAEVGHLIRTNEVSRAASAYSAHGGVRAGLLALQRNIGDRQSAVVDGRDIGTVVFPNAEIKVFLTASVAERARRRWSELQASGTAVDLAEIRSEIAARDKADTERAIAPLRQADDATLIDSTSMDIDQVVTHILGLVEAKSSNP